MKLSRWILRTIGLGLTRESTRYNRSTRLNLTRASPSFFSAVRIQDRKDERALGFCLLPLPTSRPSHLLSATNARRRDLPLPLSQAKMSPRVGTPSFVSSPSTTSSLLSSLVAASLFSCLLLPLPPSLVSSPPFSRLFSSHLFSCDLLSSSFLFCHLLFLIYLISIFNCHMPCNSGNPCSVSCS